LGLFTQQLLKPKILCISTRFLQCTSVTSGTVCYNKEKAKTIIWYIK